MVFVGNATKTHELFPPLPRPVVISGHVAGNRSKGQLDHGIGIEERNDGPLFVIADIVLGNNLFGRNNEFARRSRYREIIDAGP